VASALAAAHESGIVHRDLKPENIMVRRDGYVKVLDFGIAKLTEVATSPSDVMSAPTSTQAMPTESGIVVGTAPYMSPEQATGKPIDARSDVFSFGAVLYEMVSGRRAFAGGSAVAVAAALIEREPVPLPASVPPGLGNVIARCLRKDPARRFQTMVDLKAALDDVREGSSVVHRETAADGRRRWTWIAWPVAIGVLVVAAVLAWQVRQAPPQTAPYAAVALTTLPGVEQSPSLSPDGNYVAFAWSDPGSGNQDVYVQMIGSGEPLRVTSDPLNDYNPVWSPDGRWIAFFRSQPPAPTGLRSREVRIVPPLGGPERKLADVRGQDFPGGSPAVTPVYLAWSADSRALVVTDSPGDGQPDSLFSVSLATGEKKRLTNPQPPALADLSPSISPDGHSLVFLRRTSWGSGELHLLALADDLTAAGEPGRLTAAALRADYPTWTPDGREIVFAAKAGLWRMRAAGGNTPTRIPFIGEDGLMPVVSRAQPGRPARLVYVRSFGDSNLWRVETPAAGAPTSSPPLMAMSSTRPEYHAQFSPDGSRVAFTSRRTGDGEIWLAAADGTQLTQLTSTGALETNCPRWSPDGQHIAFSSTASGEFDIYTIPAAGGQAHRLTSHPAIDLCPVFSRDGQSIYFSSARTGDFRIWKMPAAGGDAVQVSANQGGYATESPDGTSLYYHTVSVVSSLWRMPLSGGVAEEVIDGIVWFNWALLPGGIYYIDRFENDTRLLYVDFATGKSTIVARNLGEVTAGLTATRDGTRIVFARVDTSTDDLMLVENFR
jgi:Tol biopolymer transport system component